MLTEKEKKNIKSNKSQKENEVELKNLQYNKIKLERKSIGV